MARIGSFAMVWAGYSQLYEVDTVQTQPLYKIYRGWVWLIHALGAGEGFIEPGENHLAGCGGDIARGAAIG